MSLQAVNWLSSKLGINIDGRTDADEKAGITATPSPSSQPFSSAATTLDMCLHKINDAVFGRDYDVVKDAGKGGSHVLGGRSGVGGNGDEVELDENGLPLTKNWYYYDHQLGRWNVNPDAPAHIKEEYERKLKEDEDEREGRNVIPPPPPPPPPPGHPSMPSASGEDTLTSSMYQRAGQHIPGRPPGSHPHGLFGTQQSTGPSIHRPQYAMPTYFEVSHSAPNASTTQHPFTPHQSMHQYPPQLQQQQQASEYRTEAQNAHLQQTHSMNQNFYQHHYQHQGEYTQFQQQQQYHTHDQGQEYQQQQPPQPQQLPPPPTGGYAMGEQNQSFPPSLHNPTSNYSVRYPS